ncbi:MAG TPA: ABC transporter ATP-binding protein [Methylomirabilota bacterium]|nr:ABC transporter ATP-binding protein [Methylomirabilota bacterium]
MAQQVILQVDELRTYYRTLRGPLKAVDGVSFSLQKGEILGLVGESGCGKTTLALSIVRLLPPGAEVISGKVSLDGQNILSMSEEQMKHVRWKRASIIFQGALNSLNPVLPVREQIAEAIRAHEKTDQSAVDQRINDLFKAVGLESTRKENFPHEFSGGMKQRVMIAMALACNPELVVADEPTTALDVIVQYQILDLIRNLRDRLQISMILISHDLSVVAELCDKVAIMYAGKIVEFGDIFEIFEMPKHPYTRALLKSIPKMEGAKTRLAFISGSVPDLTGVVPACRFYERCPYAQKKCAEIEPETEQVDRTHSVACHFWRDIK